MSIKFQRVMDFFLGVPVCLLFSLLDHFRKKTGETAPPRKILIILLSEMGSVVLAHPMLASLKRRYPSATLHALVFARNREALDLLGIIREEDVLTIEDGSLAAFGFASLRVLRKLRALHLDVVIDCE